MVGGGGVQAVAVLHQVEGLVEVALDQGGVCCIAGEGTVELGQLAGQAVLFFCVECVVFLGLGEFFFP